MSTTEEKKASVGLKKREYTAKTGKNAGKKDYFWSGTLYIGNQRYDVTTNGRPYQKDANAEPVLFIEIKEAKGASNRL